MRMLVRLAVLAGVMSCAACVKQVGYSALEMQESYRTLLYKQILYNLKQAAIARDEATTPVNVAFLPSQVLVITGTAQVTGSITPSVSIPLPVSTITNTVASAASPTYTNAAATNLGNASLGVQMTDSNMVQWTLTAQTDPDVLRRLRGLYLFAVGALNAECSSTTPKGDTPRDCLWNQYPMQGGNAHPNSAFIEPLGCVFCLYPSGTTISNTTSCPTTYAISPRLAALHGFIRTEPLAGWDELKTNYGLARFYVDPSVGEAGFNDFVLFILEAMSSAPTGSVAGPKCTPYYGAAPTIRGAAQSRSAEFTTKSVGKTDQSPFPTLMQSPAAQSQPGVGPQPGVGTQTQAPKTQSTLPIAIGVQ